MVGCRKLKLFKMDFAHLSWDFRPNAILCECVIRDICTLCVEVCIYPRKGLCAAFVNENTECDAGLTVSKTILGVFCSAGFY